MATKRRAVRVPRFSSIDEEREWFEKHAEEVDGAELAENPFARRTSKVAYSLRLDATDIEHLEAAARRRGVRPTQLARELILAGLLADGFEQTSKTALASLDAPAAAAALALRQWDNAFAPVAAQMNAAMAPVARQLSEQMNAAMAPVARQLSEQMNTAMAPVAQQLSESMAPLLKQFSATFAAVEVAQAASAAREAERPGQAVFEFVRVLRPDVADEVRGTDADPSQDDARLPIFFERVAALAA